MKNVALQFNKSRSACAYPDFKGVSSQAIRATVKEKKTEIYMAQTYLYTEMFSGVSGWTKLLPIMTEYWTAVLMETL